MNAKRSGSALAATSAILALLAPCAGCSGEGTQPPAPPCDQECQDSVALLSLRETVKLVYNLTLQGNPVGAQDETMRCPLGGSARVFGEATSVPEQGVTKVDLTYELSDCAYLQRDEEPPENYDMTFTGTLKQEGTLAVQPNENTALTMESDSMTFSGTVYDPPIAYEEAGCILSLGQDGDDLSGEMCGRKAGVDL